MEIQLSDRVENIVGKGEIACYEQFLFFPQCFQKLSVVAKYGKMEIQLSDRVENIVGKGEIACYEPFLFFPQCFQKLSVVDASK